jgi:hypothetical protein
MWLEHMGLEARGRAHGHRPQVEPVDAIRR